MLLLSIHVIGITMIIFLAGAVAYRMGFNAGERRARRRMEQEG